MKLRLKELKAKVYSIWEQVHTSQGALIQTQNFKSEMQSFGDLRCKQTWEKALAVFTAQVYWATNLDNTTLIKVMFNFQPQKWNYPYRYQIFEEFIAIPGAFDALEDGLEQIFGYYEPTVAKEKSRAFLELVQGESTASGTIATGTAEFRTGLHHLITQAS